jgi:hypothetical protein
MQEVLVRLWCDKTFQDTREKVQAAETVIVEYRGKRWRMDLSSGNAELLDAVLAPWLAAARPEDAPAEFHHGFKAGSAEAREWRAGLRAWADSVGRTSEYTVSHTRGGSKLNYRYPRDLERDYENHLLQQAEKVA